MEDKAVLIWSRRGKYWWNSCIKESQWQVTNRSSWAGLVCDINRIQSSQKLGLPWEEIFLLQLHFCKSLSAHTRKYCALRNTREVSSSIKHKSVEPFLISHEENCLVYSEVPQKPSSRCRWIQEARAPQGESETWKLHRGSTLFTPITSAYHWQGTSRVA